MRKTHSFSHLLLATAAVLLCVGAGPVLANITTTKHNLSASGPGTVPYRATTEERVCLMCHTPHNADPAGPLWNHTLSGQTYTLYDSSTLIAAPNQPTGKSKLCLACHDGTVAVGSIHNMPGSKIYDGIIVGLEDPITGTANLTNVLSDDHPISFVYNADLYTKNGELVDPSTLTGDIKTDENGEVQCTSCHDPHLPDDPGTDRYKFLRVGYTDGVGFGSPLCTTCHDKDYWVDSKHRLSEAEWDGDGTNPWHIDGHNVANDSTDSTPKANGCENCHQPHSGASGSKRLLKEDGESELCMVCHGTGNIVDAESNVSDVSDPTINMSIVFEKAYTHPSLEADYDGRHYPIRDETDYKLREGAFVPLDDPNTLGTESTRHAECQDCHNPHAVESGVSPNFDAVGGTSRDISPVLQGGWGVEPSWTGTGNWGSVTTYDKVDGATYQYQYQLCMKCHSYYAFGDNPPPEPYGIYNVYGSTNTITDQAIEFNPENASYHPVAAAGANNFIMTVGGTDYDYSASLLGNLTPNSMMNCSDCHSYEETFDGSGGPKGPHGSDYWPILDGPYDETTGARGTETLPNRHLCFRCHDPDVYSGSGTAGGTATGFSKSSGSNRNLHTRHVGLRDQPCIACHAAIPHGWKRRALLIYGMGPGADPAPYNGHVRYPGDGGSSAYGIPSDADLVSESKSGNWQKNDCHAAGGGSTIGVGACGTMN